MHDQVVVIIVVAVGGGRASGHRDASAYLPQGCCVIVVFVDCLAFSSVTSK